MAKGFGTTVLVAGMLAATANAAFADTRGQQPHPHNAAERRNSMTAPDAPITAITKDGKAIQLTVDIPTLNKGNFTDDQFQRSLKGGVMMSAMQTLAQYSEADIQKNIGEIQKKITDGVGAMVPMGTITGGKPDYAKPGVNYGNVTITKVTEVAGGKVVLEQKAPAAKQQAPAPKPKS